LNLLVGERREDRRHFRLQLAHRAAIHRARKRAEQRADPSEFAPRFFEREHRVLERWSRRVAGERRGLDALRVHRLEQCGFERGDLHAVEGRHAAVRPRPGGEHRRLSGHGGLRYGR